ncbi:hypothetical protein [Petroclostridium xylanilyticum]|nr:hypothetical protein [Petroclostridium xylanilyticum]
MLEVLTIFLFEILFNGMEDKIRRKVKGGAMMREQTGLEPVQA